MYDTGPVRESIEDDFWDYDRQVDLEGFSSGRVYDTLARQSRNITQTLAKQKEEVKSVLFYNKQYFKSLFFFEFLLIYVDKDSN